jgi:hypothetical protein
LSRYNQDMTRYIRILIGSGLVLTLAGCRFNANRPNVPTTSARPGSGVSTQPVAPGSSGAPGSPAAPGASAAPGDPASGSAASASAAVAIPVVARIERDLRHLPQDLAVAPDGTTWLLATDGIWQRPAGSVAWTGDAPLATVELPAAPANPPAEIVTDATGVPWILDPASGRLWQRTGKGAWQVAASGMPGATGLSVAGDGTAYAVASDATATVWKVQAGTPEPLRDATWKHPVATAVDAHNGLLVVDDVYRAVHRFGTTQKVAAIPPSLGRLTIGRDSDGTPLIVGGQRGVIAMRILEKNLGFPTLPSTSLPTAGSEGFKGLRLFIPAIDQYLLMARIDTPLGTIGELRAITAIGRKPGQTYTSSAAFTGTALTVRSLVDRELEVLGTGYRLFRVRGTLKTSEATNRTSSWLFDYWNEADRTIATVTLAPQGVTTERSYMPASLPAPALLGDVTIDSHLAWAYAVKSGMANKITADMDLRQDGADANWRITWTSGGQTYRVNAVTGAAGLETSQNAAPSSP